MNLKKDDGLYIRINTNVKKAFTKLAENKGVSMARYIDRFILGELEKEGIKFKRIESIL